MAIKNEERRLMFNMAIKNKGLCNTLNVQEQPRPTFLAVLSYFTIDIAGVSVAVPTGSEKT